MSITRKVRQRARSVVLAGGLGVVMISGLGIAGAPTASAATPAAVSSVSTGINGGGNGVCVTAIRTIWAAGPLAVTPQGAIVAIGVGGICGVYFGAQGGDAISGYICSQSRRPSGGWARGVVSWVTQGQFVVC